METLNLYHVQDTDRPVYVLAPDWGSAFRLWQTMIRAENPPDPEDLERYDDNPQPQGISFVAAGIDIITQRRALEQEMAPEPRCESGQPDCGPVTGSDIEGVPLCDRCGTELENEAKFSREEAK